MSKIVETNEKIAENVVEGYKKIEDTVVGGYKKIEDSVVGKYKEVENAFVEKFLAKDGESAEDAKKRMEEEWKAVEEDVQKNINK
ncbi:MAG: hypothetical protein ACI4WM_10185 [Erysipelotrichaceae bacterium]